MRVWLVCLLVALGTIAGSTAPTVGVIAGIVQDPTGHVLPGVLVQLILPNGRRQITTRDGTFRFTNVPNGTVGLIYTLNGFRPLRHHRVFVGTPGSTTLLATMHTGAICECVEPQPPPEPTPSQLTLDSRFSGPLPSIEASSLRAGEVPIYLDTFEGPVTLAVDASRVPDVAARLIDQVDRHSFDGGMFVRHREQMDLWREVRSRGWQLRVAADASPDGIVASIGPSPDDVWMPTRVLGGASVLREMQRRSLSGGTDVHIAGVSRLVVTR